MVISPPVFVVHDPPLRLAANRVCENNEGSPKRVGQAPIVTCTLDPGSDGVDLLVGDAADGRPAHAAPPASARICAAA
jgi:hypothetical protein